MLTITNEDNLQLLKRLADKSIDLAIIDAPYGSDNIQGGYTAGKGGKNGAAKQKKYHKALWSQPAPSDEYFKELFRVSKNQIIWGANHFISKIPYDSPAWIVWNKLNGEISFADAELAWTSFNTAVRVFNYRWNGMLQQDMKNKEVRIHPTQKPVPLYKWCLKNYAKPGDIILDTHLGSGSIAIACDEMCFDLIACEIESVHYNDAMNRIAQYQSQTKLFI